jgi:hypothetical protein
MKAWTPTYHGEHFLATFLPKRLETLRPHGLQFIGRRGVWHTAWIITPDDGGPYVGQWACASFDSGLSELGWIPFEDFDDVEPMEFDARQGTWLPMRDA